MSFDSLGLCAELLNAVAARGYAGPTHIQSQAIPVIFEGGDLLAGAQTGTGKTAAFALPIVQVLGATVPSEKRRRPRALVLVPTRELAAQVSDEMNGYARRLGLRSTMIYGGVTIQAQIERLHRGVDIVVATPGFFYLVERRFVPAVKSGNPEIADRGPVLAVAGGDGKGEYQFTEFVGTEKLFGQVHQDKLLFSGSSGVNLGERGKIGDIVQVAGDLDGYTGIEMTPVDPVETEDIQPAVAEQLLDGLPALYHAAVPGDGQITWMGDFAEVVDLLRFPPGRLRHHGYEQHKQQEKAKEPHDYPQVLNFPESIWTKPAPG